jgi:nucleoside-specific outer membrane channel protein Tsx
MKSTRLPLAAAIVAASVLFTSSSAFAEDYSMTSATIMYTHKSKADPVLGTGTSDEKLSTLQLEHFGGNSIGDIYIDAEVFNGKQVGGAGAGSFAGNTNNQTLIVFNPRVSLSKTTGANFALGPISDVSLIARFERASYADFRSDNFGVSLNFKVPGVAYLESGILRRSTNFYSGKALWRTVWFAPIDLGGSKLHFNGLLLVNGTDANGTETFARPELLYQFGAKDTFQAGVRVEYHGYQIAGRNYRRTSPTLMAKWVF